MKRDLQMTDTFHLFGNILRLRSPSADNGGKLSIVECRTKPGAGAPPNRHAAEDESFYVTSGTYEFVMDGVVSRQGPGGFLQVTNGKPHHFTNVGSQDATMLIIMWPGSGHDAFFSRVGQPIESGSTVFPQEAGPPDVTAIKAVASSCGIELMI
jgi:quercetin dioxygenase-like cupin family protein